MEYALGLIVGSLVTLVGLSKAIWPGWLIDRDEIPPGGEPTAAQLSQSRTQGLVMLAFGAILLYALLTWDGTPAEFIGV